MTTLQQALHPLLVTSSFIGLGVTRKKSKPCLNTLYILTIWSAYAYLFYYSVIALKMGSQFATVSSIIGLGINIIITVTSIVVAVHCNEKFKIFVRRLAAVDDTLEELGTPKTYGKLQKRIKGLIFVWIVFCFIINISDMVQYFFTLNDRRTLILPYIVNHYRHVNTFVCLSFIFLVWHIGIKFDQVNEHVRCLLVKEEHVSRRAWTNTVLSIRPYIIHTDNYKRVLWTSMHLHVELSHIARELNAMYGTQITLEMAVYLMLITAVTYYLYMNIRKMDVYVISIRVIFDTDLHIFMYMMKVFCLNYICGTVSAKANEIKRSIHQLTDSIRYTDIRNEISQFILQLIHHPLTFTTMGFFHFGYDFLRKFSLAVAFAIIAVQTTSTKSKTLLVFKEEYNRTDILLTNVTSYNA